MASCERMRIAGVISRSTERKVRPRLAKTSTAPTVNSLRRLHPSNALKHGRARRPICRPHAPASRRAEQRESCHDVRDRAANQGSRRISRALARGKRLEERAGLAGVQRGKADTHCTTAMQQVQRHTARVQGVMEYARGRRGHSLSGVRLLCARTLHHHQSFLQPIPRLSARSHLRLPF